MILLDGKKLSQQILADLKKHIALMRRKPSLAVVMIGSHPTSMAYVKKKKEAAKSIGVDFFLKKFNEDEFRHPEGGISVNKLRATLSRIVHDRRYDGVIIQLPIAGCPKERQQDILNAVVPEKDVDMLSARSVGDLAVGKHRILPPIAGAIKHLLEHYEIPYRTKRIVIVGQGALVGRPLALWLLGEGASYSTVNESSPDMHEQLRTADIVISGVGKKGLIRGESIKEGAVVIDAGTSGAEGNEGDVSEESVAAKASYLAPVPGGVGPLTVAMLLRNVVTLAQKRRRG